MTKECLLSATNYDGETKNVKIIIFKVYTKELKNKIESGNIYSISE